MLATEKELLKIIEDIKNIKKLIAIEQGQWVLNGLLDKTQLNIAYRNLRKLWNHLQDIIGSAPLRKKIPEAQALISSIKNNKDQRTENFQLLKRKINELLTKAQVKEKITNAA